MKTLIAAVLIVLGTTNLYAKEVPIGGGWFITVSDEARIQEVDVNEIVDQASKELGSSYAKQQWETWRLAWRQGDKKNPLDVKADRLDDDFWTDHQKLLQDLSKLILELWQRHQDADAEVLGKVFEAVRQFLAWTLQYISDFFQDGYDKVARHVMCQVRYEKSKISRIYVAHDAAVLGYQLEALTRQANVRR